MGIVELMSGGRIVELSQMLHPGQESRRLEIRRYAAPSGEFMFEVDTMSHIGTHAESPSHILPALRQDLPVQDIADIAPETWMGEAVFVNLESLPPRSAIGAEVFEASGVHAGDIVVVGNFQHLGEERARMAPAAGRWLGAAGIKLLAMDRSCHVEEDSSSIQKMVVHQELMKRGIPLIEGLVNLNEIRQTRFYFIALPYRVKGCDAWPVRAIAIEGVL